MMVQHLPCKIRHLKSVRSLDVQCIHKTDREGWESWEGRDRGQKDGEREHTHMPKHTQVVGQIMYAKNQKYKSCSDAFTRTRFLRVRACSVPLPLSLSAFACAGI